MKKIKIVVFLFVFFSSTLQIFAQKGFKVIYKAEQKYQNGKYKKALKLLSKAEKMNYGACGVSWMQADNDINLLRAKIYLDKKKFKLARKNLDAFDWLFDNDNINIDSIRIRTYQLEYGKDSLSNMIDSSLINAKIECNYNCSMIIPLPNGEIIKLKVIESYNSSLRRRHIADAKKKKQAWLRKFKASNNYKLIKEKS